MKKFRKASPVPIAGNECPASGLPHGRTAPDLASFPEALVAKGRTVARAGWEHSDFGDSRAARGRIMEAGVQSQVRAMADAPVDHSLVGPG